MYLWEEADYISFLGLDVYTYGLMCALGAGAMLLLLWCFGKGKKLPKGAAALTGVCAMLLGAFCSKLLFSLFSFNVDAPFLGKMKPGLFSGGGYSMMGALLGGFLGAALAGKMLKQSSLKFMDVFAPACLAFVFFARLGEMFYPEFAGFGVSRPLIYEFTKTWPIAVSDGTESYLATYLMEAICALVILFVLARDVKKQERDGNTFVLFLLLFGASQIIMESLRYDRHMSYTFIRMQQVLAILVLIGGLMYAARRSGKSKKQMGLLLLMMVVISVLGVALEFAIDRTELNRYLLYALFVVLVAIPVYLGMRCRKKEA
ncbi:MAG: prolipoprotein diacylglyceryl transferase [Clostridia bacterium]|nr:prolipoprotein diacylglyceryl transferase [Clostridia bacterium]